MTDCPDEKTVDAFVGGRLAPDRRRALEDHIDQCPGCQRLATQVFSRLSRDHAGARRADAAAAPTPPLTPSPTPWDATAALGRRPGRYVLLEDQAGRDGVRAAFDTLLDRKIALVLLAPAGGGAEGVPARVLAEAAAMARLSHPNVVKVHDVGVMDGQPYLAMELVDGVPLREWRQQQSRRPGEIAALMAGAARGLAAAHAAGIVHRRLDADRLVVAGGRALITGFDLSGGGGAVDGDAAVAAARSADVFAFCFVLYETLHGAPPPLAPGGGVSAAAAVPPPRSPAPARLHRLALSGLAAEPARRPADLDRFADELLAAPAARARTAAAAVVGVGLVAAAFWGGGYLRANPQRQCLAGAEAIAALWNDGRRAQVRGRYASAGKQESWPSLERKLDQYASGWQATYRETCARSLGQHALSDEVFDLRLQCLSGQRAALEALVGALPSATPQQLVLAAGAVLPQLEECRLSGRPEIKRPPSDPAARAQIAAVEEGMGQAQAEMNLGNYGQAAQSAARAVAAARHLGYEPLLAGALVQLAGVEMRRGSNSASEQETGLDRAAGLLDEAYAVAEVGRDDPRRLSAAREQIAVQGHRGRFADAQMWGDLGNALLDRLGTPPAEGAILALNLGWVEHHLGHPEAAAAAWHRALALAKKIQPPDHRRIASAQGFVCAAISKKPEQIACYREALAQAKLAFGPEHPMLGGFYNNISGALSNQAATHAESCEMLRKGIAVQEGTVSPSHPGMITMLTHLAECLATLGKIAEARKLYEEVVSRKPGPSDLPYVHENFGRFLAEHGEPKEAEPHLRASGKWALELYGATHSAFTRNRIALSDLLQRMGRLDEGIRLIDEALEGCRRAGVDDAEVAYLLAAKGRDYLAAGRLEPALRAFQEAFQKYQRLKTDDREMDITLHGLGATLLALGRVPEAIPYFERALTARVPDNVLDPERRGDTAFALARALAAQPTDHPRACTLAREAAAIYRRHPWIHREKELAHVERFLTRERCTPAT